MNLLKRLWCDEGGFVISTELVLVATLLIMALVVGLEAVRNAVLTELADTATAIAQANQSYSFSGVTGHASVCVQPTAPSCQGSAALGSASQLTPKRPPGK